MTKIEHKIDNIFCEIGENYDALLDDCELSLKKCSFEELYDILDNARQLLTIAEQEYIKEQEEEAQVAKRKEADYICGIATHILDNEITDEDFTYLINRYFNGAIKGMWTEMNIPIEDVREMRENMQKEVDKWNLMYNRYTKKLDDTMEQNTVDGNRDEVIKRFAKKVSKKDN